MSAVSQLNPVQFDKKFPNGAYSYILVWGPEHIKPATIMYPFALVTLPVGSGTDREFFAKDLKTGLVKRLGYFPHHISFASTNLEDVVEAMKRHIKRSAEGRMTWLAQQSQNVDGIAQGIYTKLNKM